MNKKDSDKNSSDEFSKMSINCDVGINGNPPESAEK